MGFPTGATFPLVVFIRISTEREQAMNDGVVARHPTFQVEAWDDDYHGCVALAAQLETCLSTMAGSSVTVGDRELVGETDLYDPETGLYHRPLDVRIATWN